MFTIRLEVNLGADCWSSPARLAAARTTTLARRIRQYIEDHEDYRQGIAVLRRKEGMISLNELERNLREPNRS